ncbi:MAG: redoxin domain-containing protein [Candidatus Hinthialibacter sp.]
MKMFRKVTIAVLFAALMIPAGFSTDAAESQATQKAYKVGDAIEPFTLQCQEGKEHDLSKNLGKKIIVLDFWNCQCPVSRGFENQLKEIAQKYSEKDVVFYAIDSNTNNSVELIQKYAKDQKLKYPVLKDWENKIADKFDAAVTPEVFVIGKDKKIHYHGAISNNQNASKVEKHYLADALDSLIAGKPVEVKEIKAFGCTIKRVSQN